MSRDRDRSQEERKQDKRGLPALLNEIRACRVCEESLELGPRPIVAAHVDARILIIGQAPGAKVHASGIPWDDASGNRLREWLGLSREQFYDPRLCALVPMGFCYPGKGKSGDLAPRPECQPLWHPPLLERLSKVELTLLIGRYAQQQYLPESRKLSLTEVVHGWRDAGPDRVPLPHPSPRNNIWLAKNPWFEKELVPALKAKVGGLIQQ